jgi:rhodanese-related sulfurtransferase
MDQFSEFAGNNLLLVVALMVSFFVLVISELRRKASGLVAIDPTEAVGLINGDAAVLDLRSADSFALGHIVNARNIPMDDFDVTQGKVAGLKNKSVLAVCDSGTRSNKAVDQMRKSGFESVYGLKGGMAAWSQAGLPVVTGKKTKSKK